jgi:hypothetical protein
MYNDPCNPIDDKEALESQPGTESSYHALLLQLEEAKKAITILQEEKSAEAKRFRELAIKAQKVEEERLKKLADEAEAERLRLLAEEAKELSRQYAKFREASSEAIKRAGPIGKEIFTLLNEAGEEILYAKEGHSSRNVGLVCLNTRIYRVLNYIITNKNVYMLNYEPVTAKKHMFRDEKLAHSDPSSYDICCLYTFASPINIDELQVLQTAVEALSEFATADTNPMKQITRSTKNFEVIIRCIPGSYTNGDWNQLDGFFGPYINVKTKKIIQNVPSSNFIKSKHHSTKILSSQQKEQYTLLKIRTAVISQYLNGEQQKHYMRCHNSGIETPFIPNVSPDIVAELRISVDANIQGFKTGHAGALNLYNLISDDELLPNWYDEELRILYDF